MVSHCFFLNTLFKFFSTLGCNSLKYTKHIYASVNFLHVYTLIKSSPDQDEEHYPYPRELTYAPSQSIPPKGNCLFSPVTTN